MSEEPAQLPVRRASYREVHFDGDTLTAVILEGEGVAIPVRTICEVLGLDLEAQSNRLRAHEVLARGLRIVNVPIGNRVRSVIAVLHRWIPFWLATISPNLVREDVRPKLVRYQIEVADVLATLYGSELASGGAPDDEAARTLQQQYAQAIVEARLAREAFLAAQQQLHGLQAAQEQANARLDSHEVRIDAIAGLMDDLQTQIASYTTITAAQQEVIKRSIQQIAARYKRKTGTDIFARLFAAFCADLQTPKYSLLPAGKYDAALEWLRQKAAEYLPDDPDALPPLQEALL
jgi:hypothetical protein